MNNYRQLKVWQKSISLVKEVYAVCDHLSNVEVFTLKKQMHKCSIAIPSHIAEGYARTHKKEFVQLLNISRGLLFELQTHLVICKELGFVETVKFDSIDGQCLEIEKMLNSFIQTLLGKK